MLLSEIKFFLQVRYLILEMFVSVTAIKTFFRNIGLSPRSSTHIFYLRGGPRDFFESETLAKRDLFGPVKDAGNFLGRKKTQGFYGYCTFYQLKSTITSAEFTAGVGFF